MYTTILRHGNDPPPKEPHKSARWVGRCECGCEFESTFTTLDSRRTKELGVPVYYKVCPGCETRCAEVFPVEYEKKPPLIEAVAKVRSVLVAARSSPIFWLALWITFFVTSMAAASITMLILWAAQP